MAEGRMTVVEKRSHVERDPCAISASIRDVDGDARTECMIVDLTEQGAGLALAETVALSPLFFLGMPIADDLLDERLVELRWRRGPRAGVRFVKA